MFSFIDIFICIFGAILGTWDISVNKTFKALCSCGVDSGHADKQ